MGLTGDDDLELVVAGSDEPAAGLLLLPASAEPLLGRGLELEEGGLFISVTVVGDVDIVLMMDVCFGSCNDYEGR